MRALCFSALLAVSLVPAGQVNVREIRVLSPGVVYNAGLLDLAAAFTKETGTKVAVTSVYITRPEAAAVWKAKGLDRF
jgi:ABC-type tungstate transport system permease subunit